MANQDRGDRPLSEAELQEMVSSSDSGARSPTGAVAILLAWLAPTLIPSIY